MSEPLHDAMITNLSRSNIQWVKKYICCNSYVYIDGLGQDGSNSIANALELLQYQAISTFDL